MNDFIINHSKKDIDFLSNLAKDDADIKLEDVTIKAPIIFPRQDIICLGLNYLEHAKESLYN